MEEIEKVSMEEIMGNFEKELAKKYKVPQIYITLKIEEYYEQQTKRNQEIVEKWRNGATKTELEDEYGIPKNAIYMIIRRYSKEKEEEEDKDKEIAEKMEKGATRTELADEYGVSKGTISYRVTKYYNRIGRENPRKPNKILSEEEIKEIIEKWEDEKAETTKTELAEEYGVAVSTISSNIKKYYKQTGKKNPREREELPIDEIVEKLKNGQSKSKLASDYHTSIKTMIGKVEEHKGVEKLRVVRSSNIIVEYLKKGLSPEEIIETAEKKNVLIPDSVMQKAVKKAEGIPNVRIKEEAGRGIDD